MSEKYKQYKANLRRKATIRHQGGDDSAPPVPGQRYRVSELPPGSVVQTDLGSQWTVGPSGLAIDGRGEPVPHSAELLLIYLGQGMDAPGSLTLPDHWGRRRRSDYQGATNWHTWNSQLMADNDQEHYNAVRKLMAQGATPEDLRDYYLRHIIGPHNADAIRDAQSWNDIPEHDRLDHNYEAFKDKHGDDSNAMDLIHGLVGGPDVSDVDPTLIDPELVNWDEIHQNLRDEHDENAQYEQDMQRNRDLGLGWGTNHDLELNQMRDAFLRHHGYLPDEELEGDYNTRRGDPRNVYGRPLNIPFDKLQQIPGWERDYLDDRDMRDQLWNHRVPKARQRAIDEYTPAMGADEAQRLVHDVEHNDRGLFGNRGLAPWMPGGKFDTPLDLNDPEEAKIFWNHPTVQQAQQQGKNVSPQDLAWETAWASRKGQQHPYTPVMEQALQGRGYSPQEIQQIMQQQLRWDPEKNNWVRLNQPQQLQPDPALDQPGDLTLPPNWSRRRR